ncbi:MAG: hypothetical protein ILP09_00055, partial [Oscillospiraceae bacterium]|nr:hypothetical protein [Oscillospiraceae bacterium]
MKTKRKLLALLIAMVMVLGLLPMGALAAPGDGPNEFIVVENEVVASLPEGTLVSAVSATVPAEYGTAYYPDARCVDVTLTANVADDASIDVRLFTYGNNGEDASHLLSPIGFTKEEASSIDELVDPDFGSYIDAIVNKAFWNLSFEESVFEDEKVVFIYPVQLTAGTGQLLLYYYREDVSEPSSTSDAPIALILNLHKEGVTPAEPDSGHDLASNEFSILENEIVASLPEGALASAASATVPAEYGTAYYPDARCVDVTLTANVADDA